MWNLIVNYDGRPSTVNTFPTKRDAQNEINNRWGVTRHLGYDPKEIYKIKKEYSKRRKTLVD